VLEQTSTDASSAALADITVLELTNGVAGGYCGRLLAMLGAHVVKVESRHRPDVARTAGPFPGDVPDFERSGLHRFLHAQKRSLALHVGDERGFALLARLADRADVVLDDGALGAPPAASDRYRALLARNERLIVNAFSPFGLEGPKAGRVSTELVDLAAGGWLQCASPGLPPLMPGTPCAHHAAGTFGAVGVLLALRARRLTGRGQLVETRTNEALLSMLTCPTTLYAMTGIDGYRAGDGYPFAIYRCADGHLGVSILTQAHYTGLCDLMGRPELKDDPVLSDGVQRATPAVAAQLHGMIATWIADQPAQATFERGQSMRVPVAIVPSPTEVLASAQYASRGFWVDVDDPQLGALRLPGLPFRSARGLFARFAPAPAFDADGGEVLASVGLAADDRATLAGDGVLA
jgi:crotonobetainyl-CoA:carnitine CoA-transferase CaiB-like acyl-CoA transferase